MEAGTGLHDQATELAEPIAARSGRAGGQPSGSPGRKLEGVSAAQIGVVVLVAALIGAGAGFGGHFLFAKPGPSPATTPSSAFLHGEATWPAGTRPAPPITTLRDQSGHRFSLAGLRGRTVAMAFFDSHCTQACPLEGRALAAAERELPGAQRPVLVVVSVNPLDTPASTRAAARKWGLARVAAWHWLRGSHAQLQRVWKAYHIFVAPPVNGDIGHTEALYLIDRRGYERSGYVYPFVPRFVTLDLRTLGGPARGRAR
jgi:cytochrome oxidase Cu insertion factor (SCO1/SenC/PrrC family)